MCVQKIGSDEKTTHVEYVICDCCAIKILDLTAISALAEVRFNKRKGKIYIYIYRFFE